MEPRDPYPTAHDVKSAGDLPPGVDRRVPPSWPAVLPKNRDLREDRHHVPYRS